MTAERCRQWRESLGAHALGQLPDEERTALQAHLEGCAECRAELESLSSVARLMPMADPGQLDAAPAPPKDLAERVVTSIRAEKRARRRGRWRLGLAGAGATAAVAAALIAIFVLPDGQQRPEQHVDFGALPGGLKISATLQPHSFGTEVHVYVKGVRPGTPCRVFLRGASGSRVPAGSFRYRRNDDSRAILSSALALARAEAIGVRVGDRTFVTPVSTGPA